VLLDRGHTFVALTTRHGKKAGTYSSLYKGTHSTLNGSVTLLILSLELRIQEALVLIKARRITILRECFRFFSSSKQLARLLERGLLPFASTFFQIRQSNRYDDESYITKAVEKVYLHRQKNNNSSSITASDVRSETKIYRCEANDNVMA